MRDMIVDSSNDATGLVVDVLGTTSGRNYRQGHLKPGSLSAILSTATSIFGLGWLRWKHQPKKLGVMALWARTNVFGEWKIAIC